MKPAFVISTYPTRSSASETARDLVGSRLAACVNISEISSIYSWKGRIEDASEYIALFKTTQKNSEELKRRIQDSHPYDVPEVAEIDVNSINDSYMRWLTESTV